MQISILGAGGFGCALAIMCANNGHTVHLWTNSQPEVEALNRDREHKRLLPGVAIPPAVEITLDLSPISRAELILLAVPSFAIREVSHKAAAQAPAGIPVACVAKGFEPETYKLLADVIEEEMPRNPCVILSGPSHAEEVGRGVPTTIVAASRSRAAAEMVQDELMTPLFRIYVNDDVTGVELGGALKNVIALAAGISDGLKIGDNAKAALMTRGITEIARLGVAMGAKSETFAGLSGIGDLIVTCTSMHSRNRRAGIFIGEGLTAKEAIAQVGMTVEGYTATLCAWRLSQQYGVDMPIIRETYKVLYEDKDPKDAIKDLMNRPKRHESEVIWLLSK